MGSAIRACSARGQCKRALMLLTEATALGLNPDIDSSRLLLMNCELHGQAHTEAAALSSLYEVYEVHSSSTLEHCRRPVAALRATMPDLVTVGEAEAAAFSAPVPTGRGLGQFMIGISLHV